MAKPAEERTAGRIRGSVLVHLRAHVEARAGAAGWARVVERVPTGDRDALSALLINGAWYPVGLWNRGWQAHVAATNLKDPAAEIAELALRIADADLHTVFKLTLKLASPTQIIRRAEWLWSRYFDMGTVTVHDEGTSQFRMRLEAPTGEDEGPGPAICTYGVPRWMTHALSLSGAQKVTFEHVKCRFTFSRYCEYRVAW